MYFSALKTGMILFDDKIEDTTNSYTAATGLFTVPVSGRYGFRLHLRTSGGSTITDFRNKYTVYLSGIGKQFFQKFS